MTDLTIEEYLFSLPRETLALLLLSFWLVIHLHCEMLPDQFCRIWLNLSRVYIPVHSISSHIISNQFISTVPHARAITLPPPCLIDDVVIFGLYAVPYPLNTFLFPSFLVKVDLGFSELCSLF